MYAKQLTQQKATLIEPILRKIQNNQELLISNQNPEILEAIRTALYTWQAINHKQGKLKIIRIGNPLKILKIINRELIFSCASTVAVPETKLSAIEELSLSIAEINDETTALEALHNKNIAPEQIYEIIQEWRKTKGEGEI